MKEVVVGSIPVRPVIVGTLVACAVVAMAPWFSGGQEPVALLVSAGVLLTGAVLAWLQPQAQRLVRGPLVVSWVILIGWATLSLWWSANRYSTVLWVSEWVMAGLAFRLAYTAAAEARGREWLLRGYLASAGIFSAVAVWLFLTNSYPRLIGWFYWPNPAAAYLMPAIILSVDRLRRAEGRMLYVWGAASAGLVGTFLLTSSRAAYAVLVLVLVLYLGIVRIKEFWIRFLFTIILGIALSTGMNALSTVTAHHSWDLIPGSRTAKVAGGEPTNLRDRLNFVESAFEMWWVRPLTGTGAGTYGDVHPQYQQRVVSASTDAHDIYAQTLAELGLVGAVALAAVLLWLLAGSVRGLVTNPELVPVALGVLALLVHFGFDIDASYPALLMLAAVLFGVLYEQWWPTRGRVKLWWPVVAAAVLVPVASVYMSEAWAVRGAAAQLNGDFSLAASDYAMAHHGLVYNPDYVDAEGIDHYALAVFGGSGPKPQQAALALKLARQAEVLDPSDGQHWQLEGRILAQTGDLKGAEAAYRQALKLDPYNHPEYAWDLAVVQARAGDPKGAVRTAEAMLALYPPSVVANRNMDVMIRPTLAQLRALVIGMTPSDR